MTIPLSYTLLIATTLVATIHTAIAQEVAFHVPRTFLLRGAPTAIVAEDFTDDGHLDLVVTNHERGMLAVFQGTGTGDFIDAGETATSLDPAQLAPGDYNGDGKLDLVVSESESNNIHFHRGNNDGTFGLPRTSDGGHDPAGVVAADMNGDDKLDVLVASIAEVGGRIHVALGQGNGSFLTSDDTSVPLSDRSYSVAVGDFDEDNKLDAAAVTVDDSLAIMRGDGTGKLGLPVRYDTGRVPTALAVAELDGDQHLDIVTADTASNQLSIFNGNGAASFQRTAIVPVGLSPYQVVVRDLDANGALDVVTGNNASADISVVLGSGGGHFGRSRSFLSGIRTAGIAVGDFDENGLLDVAAVSEGTDTPNLMILLARPISGAYTGIESLIAQTTPGGVAAGDMNGDTLPDLVVSVPSESAAYILPAQGARGFGPTTIVPVGVAAAETQLADLNRDGRIDIVASNPDSPNLSVVLARATGGFVAPTLLTASGPPSGLVLGDFDHDGSPDIATAGSTPPGVSIFFGRGDGTFEPLVTIGLTGVPGRVGRGDFDRDGTTDIAIGNGQARRIDLLLGRSSRTLEARSVSTSEPAELLTAADFDGDGGDDIAVILASTASARIYFGADNTTFTPGTSFSVGDFPRALSARDLNGDALPELLAANQTTSTISIVPNTGDRKFGERQALALSLHPMAVATADFDGDGQYDFAASGSGVWVGTNAGTNVAVRGDGNGDQGVTAADVTALWRVLPSADDLPVEQVVRAGGAASAGVDADGDARLSMLDVQATMRRLFSAP